MVCSDIIFHLFTLLLLTKFSSQATLPTDITYNAAVVEFSPTLTGTDMQRMTTTTLNILSIIESDVTDNLDIIVFPKNILSFDTLRTYVPEPAAQITPCNMPDYESYMVEISCAARSRKVYVVINVLEKFTCNPLQDQDCPSSGLMQYNTNVVFDRMGTVISTYRQIHLYGNEWYSTQVSKNAELATFETDFGVTFGHFTAFDILFYEPAMSLIRGKNIKDFIYASYWFNELPFLVATQLQEGWALANDINLLAAGFNNPTNKNTGSGIYAGKLGRLTAEIFQIPTTQVLSAVVPKYSYRSNYSMPTVVVATPTLENERFTKLSLLRDYNVDIFTTQLLSADFTKVQNEMLCHATFCCNFNITRVLLTQTSVYSAYRYRMVAYFGSQTTFQRKDPSDMGVCAIIACTNENLYSCGHIFPDTTLVGNKFYFSQLDVQGDFPNNVRRLIMPSTVDGLMKPLYASMFKLQEIQG